MSEQVQAPEPEAQPEVKKEKKAKAKKPEAPKGPGPKTVHIEFPANTTHELKDGGSIEIVKRRLSYLVKQSNGKLRWFSAAAVKSMVVERAA